LEGGGWQALLFGCFTPGKDLVPDVQEAGWVSEADLDSSENLGPNVIISQPPFWYLPRHNPLTLKVNAACSSETSFSMANHAQYQNA
jgi:hypothetical protein